MRILITSLCFVWLFMPLSSLLGQELPQEMRFSPDGERLVSGGQATTGFYDEDDIPIIELTFTQSNYWTLLTNNYDTSTDLMASVSIDGEVYDSVGVRFKGATSYFRNNTQKKSFNISLNYLIDGQDHKGYETLNLNCHYEDPSYLREVFYNSIGRNYTPALKANFSLLRINGQDWGVYANTQQLNGEYLKEWFLSNDGTRWRAQDPDFTPGGGGGGPGGGGGGGNQFGKGTSTLNYNGPDSTDYNTDYTLKKTQKTDPWADLIKATDKLNNLPLNQLADSLPQYIDVDKALWFLAHEIVLTDEDSYIWKGGMDYYVYWEPETDRIVPLEYDGNSCMQLNATTWSPFYNENDVRFPLMNRLFAVPELRQRYLAHLRTILNEYYVVSEAQAKIDAYASVLDSLVQADPYQIYSYSEFLTEVSSLKSFLNTRHNYLSSHVEVNASGLDIQQVSFATNGQVRVPPTATELVQVSAALSGTMGVYKAYLYYGSGWVGAFHKVEMLDDGNHNDGSANDGVYGAEIPPHAAGTYVRYYIEAVANNTALTATYMPKGAEHDVYIYQVKFTSANSELVINELMATNSNTVADSEGDFDDWVELFNLGTNSIDLSGYFLSDDGSNLTKWAFPTGTSIDGGSYLTIWADNDASQSSQTELHAEFKLSASGETLYLLNADTVLIDKIGFNTQTSDQGFARVPNGIGAFTQQNPTFGSNNDLATPIEAELASSARLKLYPNPSQGFIVVHLLDSRPDDLVSIYDLNGRRVANFAAQDQMKLDLTHLPSGLYYVQYQGLSEKLVLQH